MKIELLLLFMLMAIIIEPSFACDASPNCLPNSTFVEIASLADEDAHNLGGMAYNETLPALIGGSKLLRGKRVGFVVAPCFEEIELTMPFTYLMRLGATVDIIAPWWAGDVASCNYARAKTWLKPSHNFTSAQAIDWDALIVPGGQWSSAVVRGDSDAQALLKKQFFVDKRLLAPVCSGSSVLIDIHVPRVLNVTGSPANRVDIENAGFTYVDEPVVIDSRTPNLITGRSPQGQDNQLFTLAIATYLLRT